MKLPRLLACTFALSIITLTSVAAAGDPFNDARHAIGIKDNETVLRLIDSGQFEVNAQNSEGYTLLHFAADQNNLEIARELLRRGANPNIRTNSGSTVADMAYSGSMLLTEVQKAGGKYARNAPYTSSPAPMSQAPAQQSKPAIKAKSPASAQANDPRRKMCNARHYSSSALCSDSTCKMREYRKWQTCLKTGSYY